MEPLADTGIAKWFKKESKEKRSREETEKYNLKGGAFEEDRAEGPTSISFINIFRTIKNLHKYYKKFLDTLDPDSSNVNTELKLQL